MHEKHAIPGQPRVNLPRAFLFLIGAHIMFTLLDATGKTLASEIGVPLIALARHSLHALVMLLFFFPLMGREVWRKLAGIDNSISTIFIASVIGTAASVLALPLQAMWGGWPSELTNTQILLLLSSGITGAISQWCLIRAYYWSSASFIATLVFLQIIWATQSGWFFFGQLPDALTFLGMSIICVTGVSVMLIEQRRAS